MSLVDEDKVMEDLKAMNVKEKLFDLEYPIAVLRDHIDSLDRIYRDNAPVSYKDDRESVELAIEFLKDREETI